MFLRRLTASLYRIHPFLFVIYFPIALLAANLGEVLPASVLRPLLVSVCFALIAWGFSWLLARNWDKAALMASAAVVLFFSYGHVYGIVKTWVIGDVLIGRHRLLTPLWGILWLAWCWWVIQARRNLDLLGKAFCVVALTLMFMPGFSISRYYLPELFQKHPEDASDHPAPQQNTAQTLPDVYYIILDAYGRSDVIKDLYDYDNSSFISYLKEKGFFVADESHSNYNQTVLSLPSSLNMDYINDLAVQMGAASTDRRPLLEKIADNQVSEIFKGLGYQFVTFDTGSLITQIKDSDIYLSPSYQNISQEQALLKGIYLDDFEGLFLKTTMARVWFDEFLARQNNVTNFAIEFPYIKHRVRILYIFDQLGEIPAWNGNYFVFAHIFSPPPTICFWQPE